MAIVNLRNVSIGFGGTPLLEQVSFQIEAGERLGLVGRNGEGKSTLLHLACGSLEPDSGEVETLQGLRIGMLDQEVPTADQSVWGIVLGGLGASGALMDRYRRLAGHSGSSGNADELERLHQALDDCGGWETRHRAEAVASRMGLDLEARFQDLSAGQKRRALMARAVVGDPDLLLLDEPTNHLDITTIDWLEDYLGRRGGTLMFVTHDRAFLERLATRILFLDRGRLTSYPCDYATFIRRRDEMLHAEVQQTARFDRKLAEEETWIRQGIKARRRRNQGRLKSLIAMREVRRSRRVAPGSIRMLAQEAERSGKLVIEAEDLVYRWNGQTVIDGFSSLIMRGDRVGIIGPSGAGKSTLIRLLLGRLKPDQGRLRHGTRLEVAYFDQLRDQLDLESTVVRNVAEGKDTVQINGKSRHVMSYLKDFLFAPDRARSPVKTLSGGERNRLLLAKLFTRPSNLLVLDEPTNDLDIESLELLEELLLDYSGTLLVVSHDRAFLNNVVTSILAFEGSGCIAEYVGGYDDWLRQRPASPPKPAEKSRERASRPRRQRERKLTFNEARELEALPVRIEALEAEQAALFEVLSAPDLYRGPGTAVADSRDRLRAIEVELAAAYERWEALESLKP